MTLRLTKKQTRQTDRQKKERDVMGDGREKENEKAEINV